MSFHKESGDVIGLEIFLVFSRDGYFVIFQGSEGSPSAPLIVPASIKNGNVTFTVPEGNGYSGRFDGHISNGMLVGSFKSGALSTSGDHELKLRKKK